jgi:putative ABC transport system ATP-binding protein
MTKPGENGAVIISARGVCKVFGAGERAVTALDDVDLELYRGELTLLMGPSGSGKSSLVAAMGGLQGPDTGEVCALGENLWEKSRREVDRFRRDHCGFVFQTVSLFPSLTALQQIALPLTYMGVEVSLAIARAEKSLDEVGLLSRAFSKPGQLSGGENQRVAIARMLAKDPSLIFADEPTAALDTLNGHMVIELLQRSARTHNAMVLCVTHDTRLREHADRVVTIEDGHILSDDRSKMAAF